MQVVSTHLQPQEILASWVEFNFKDLSQNFAIGRVLGKLLAFEQNYLVYFYLNFKLHTEKGIMIILVHNNL